jgi:hypothetical protein
VKQLPSGCGKDSSRPEVLERVAAVVRGSPSTAFERPEPRLLRRLRVPGRDGVSAEAVGETLVAADTSSVDELRRDAADRMGQALWPDEKLRPTETRTETRDQRRRTRRASDLERTRSEASSWSRLSESNRRPTHYEVEDRRSGLDQ